MKKIRPHRPNKRSKDPSEAFFSEKDSNKQQNTNEGFFQAKLDIGDPSSPFEQEADAMADHILQKGSKKSEGDAFGKQSVQRMEEEEPAAKRIQRMEEEEPAAKRIQRMEEEEPAAKRIQRMEEEEPAAKRIQRMEEEEPAAKRIQRQTEEEAPAAKNNDSEKNENTMGSMQSMDAVESMIQETKGQGMPLPEEIRSELESEFKTDFSNVRIHTDAKAIEMSAMLNAQAFTHGYDIYFNVGKYDPYSRGGKHLLIHELTHVVQQKG